MQRWIQSESKALMVEQERPVQPLKDDPHDALATGTVLYPPFFFQLRHTAELNPRQLVLILLPIGVQSAATNHYGSLWRDVGQIPEREGRAYQFDEARSSRDRDGIALFLDLLRRHNASIEPLA